MPLSQEQIDRRKHLGANLTRVGSAVGLAGLGVYGAGVAAPKLAQAGKLVKLGEKYPKLAPHLTVDGAKKFKAATEKKSAGTAVLGGGISGINGFNNASWQSAEAKRGKMTVKKNDYVSPFEDVAFAGEESGQRDFDEISKIAMPAPLMAMGAKAVEGAKAMKKPSVPAFMKPSVPTGAVKPGLSASIGANTQHGMKALREGAAGAKAGVTATPHVPASAAGSAGMAAGAGARKFGQGTLTQIKAHPVAAAGIGAGAVGAGAGLYGMNRKKQFGKASPEDRRMGRTENYRRAADITAGAAGVGAVHQAYKAGKAISASKPTKLGGKDPKLLFRSAPLKAAGAHSGRAALLAVGAGAAYEGGKKIRQKQATTWQPYVSKSATSAFGIQHD